ncbi:MAG: putative O-glycosylation ligase, exosortase A system-associated [Lamprocystis purpurea]|nr:putative O-glycosylation ligase, exosortase A system-associated [Lamprocystis purpurea]
MRDYIVALVVFGCLPLILRKPFFGILVWSWLSLMNPHRLGWSFATEMPFAQIVAVTLMLSLLIAREVKRLPAVPLTWLLAFWWFWWFVTTLTAFYPAAAWAEWDRTWKILLLTFLMIALLTTRERINALVWVIVLSLGFYGVKGGIFTLLGGGVNHVNGPPGSFISGNNEIGLALVMTVPMIRYLQLISESRWIRYGMLAMMVLTLMAIFGTQSRGALVGMIAMTFYLAMKSSNKAGLLLLLALAFPLALMTMPETWYSRMDSIQAYQADASAQGRINAWWTAWYVALDHPLVGGGADMFNRQTYALYAPNRQHVLDVHSIYFEALGEHGFVGLFTFLAIGLGALVTLNRVIRFAKPHAALGWMRDLASMIFVSLIGYATSGLFLGLSMFDYYYMLIAITIGLAGLTRRYARDGGPIEEPPGGPPGVTGHRRRAAAGAVPAGRRLPLGVSRLASWFARL